MKRKSKDKFNPQQNFDFSRVTNGQETAIKDARDLIAELEEKNRNLQSQIDSPKNVGQRNANRAAMQRNQEEIDAWKSILSRYDSQENAMAETAENEEQAAAEARENEIEAATDKGDRIEVNDEGVGSPDVTTVGENVQPTVPETENEEEKEIQPIGKGVFGNIYDQFKGKVKEAIDFLLKNGSGEAVGALHHKDVGDIDIVYGNDKAGLKKIANKHPEVLYDLQNIIDGTHIVSRSDNRIKLESDTHFVVISRDYQGNEHSPWLLTAYEKKRNSDQDNTMNTAKTQEGNENDTATPENTVSETKDSAEDTENQEEEKEKEKGQSEDSGTEEENTEDEVSDETKALRDDISETMRSIEKEIAKMNNTVSKLATRYRNATKVRNAINGFLERLNEYGTDVPQDVQDEIDRLVEERDKAVGIIEQNNAERSTGGRAGIIDPKDVDKDDYKTRLMIALSGDVLTNNIFAAEIESFVKRYFRIDAKGKLDKMNRGEMIDYVVDVIERESESSEGISINKAKEDAFNYFTDQISRNKK